MHKPSGKVLTCIFTVVVLCLVVLFFNTVREHGKASEIVHFDDGWAMVVNDSLRIPQEQALSTLPNRVKAGDSLVFENTLPEKLPARPMLRFRTFHSAVKVFINGNVYDYGLKKFSMNQFLGNGLHYVVLNPEDAGKTIRIMVWVAADNAFNTYPKFDFLSAEKAISDYNATHLIEIAVGLFLVLFGILSVLLAFFLSLWGRAPFRFLMIGLISFLLGLWTLCYTKLMQTFSMDFAFNTTLEYFTLYATPIPFGLLLVNMYKSSHRNWKVSGLKIFVAFESIFLLVASILHGTGIFYFNRLLWIFHLFLIFEFIYIGAFILPYKKNSSLSGKIMTWGMAIFAVIAFFDLLRYNVGKFYMVKNIMTEIALTPIGILFFILLLLASYLTYLKDVIAAKAEKDVLSSMVYLDSLTGLFNRTKCGQVFDILSAGKENFAIVSLDMNGLKLVNDSYGHSAGDAMIKAFGESFKEAFTGVGTSIRMGGDEFVAIVREEHLKDIREALERLETLLVQNSRDLPVRLEAAYGWSLRSECGNGSAKEVYQQADKKMYEMKKNMKSELVRG